MFIYLNNHKEYVMYKYQTYIYLYFYTLKDLHIRLCVPVWYGNGTQGLCEPGMHSTAQPGHTLASKILSDHSGLSRFESLIII